MTNHVYIVYEATEKGPDQIISIHRKKKTALYACAHWNKKCNPKKEPGMDNFYVEREDLEE